MAAAMLTARSCEPLGYDFGQPLNNDLPLLQDWELELEMQDHFPLDVDEEMLWPASSPTSHSHSHSSHSAAAKSPAQHAHPLSAHGSASLSPNGVSPILTPTSTLPDYNDDILHADAESAEEPTSSPDSHPSSIDGFVIVPRFGGESKAAHRSAMDKPPPQGSGAVLPPTTIRPSRRSHNPSLSQSHSPQSQSASATQWGSLDSSPSVNWMDHHHQTSQEQQQQQQQLTAYTTAADMELAAAYATHDFMFNGTASFFPDPIPFHTVGGSSQFNTLTQSDNNSAVFGHQSQAQRLNTAPLYGLTGGQNQIINHYGAQDFAFARAQPAPLTTHPHHHQQQQQSAQILYSHVSGPQLQPALPSATSNLNVNHPGPARPGHHIHHGHAFHPSAATLPGHHNPLSLPGATTHPPPPPPPARSSSHPYRPTTQPPLVPDVIPSGTGPIRATPRGENVRKGGRSKNSHLPEQSRLKSSEMRKVGACWRCALQRDPCDHGDPCSRCMMRLQKGQTYYFDCDRSKLPDLVHDFLPPSMTLMHQKQSIEDCVKDQVHTWDPDNGFDIWLSSGYGPALPWKLYEFKPKSEELLNQLQYFQNDEGQSLRLMKYSPPFGLMKLDTSDDAHFETYLDQLLLPEHLQDFGESCYEEETLADPAAFQATLLDLLCRLYTETEDQSLKLLLRDILRMMIITYIMGHTLTIVQDTLWSVVRSVRHTATPAQMLPHTSPRLANRQLKFFFAVLRGAIYEKILKWQQATLHTAGKKAASWLPTFCVMLGFAMVLEEIERTIHIQADAKAARAELSPDAAHTEAFNACERIDGRFKLLVGLFQCKYRDKRWGDTGSFGPGTPELADPAARRFLKALRGLVEERVDHLKSRENVTFSSENQCLYTTRLTARFLLPFLNLPS